MSRMAAALATLLAAAPGFAQSPPSDLPEAIETYRRTFKPVAEIDCPRGEDGEIVVCGRSPDEPDPNRPPMPYPPVPGDRTRMVLGEVPRATLTPDACLAYQRCGNGGVSISINILALPSLIGKVIDRIEDR